MNNQHKNQYSVLLDNVYKNEEENNDNKSNILKNSTTLNLDEYERIQLEKQYNKLYENIIIINNNNVDKKLQERIYNLSLKIIANNTAKTFMDILNELTVYMNEHDKTWDNFTYIFVKNGRLLYIGVMLIVLSLIMFVISFGS